ncbi:hypothetical protein, partial [Treponema endosymbiont of Eucomonympha sp.]|uniref:hypothetical protein n=1 Tax=Treponema endosymbiont of Eucomonympha sp. TaxID=1580831 RepID=UPI000A88293B
MFIKKVCRRAKESRNTGKRLPCLSRRLAGGERESRNTGKRLPCLPSDMRAVSASGAIERSCRRAKAFVLYYG